VLFNKKEEEPMEQKRTEPRLVLVTSNTKKVDEARGIIPNIEQLDLELPEIQSLNLVDIIEAKLIEARKYYSGPLLVDDTALYLECLKGTKSESSLPGPFIKWFLKSMGNSALVTMAESLGCVRAEAVTMIGYADEQGKHVFFKGSLYGNLVMPQGNGGFGWDLVFKPDGYDTTLAAMSLEAKSSMSMRAKALIQFVDFYKK
jgi:inosine triphosphate pyrophosphatase